ncbi:MAG: hypothetical protein R6W71_11255 [Bacteroidales bacterium]
MAKYNIINRNVWDLFSCLKEDGEFAIVRNKTRGGDGKRWVVMFLIISKIFLLGGCWAMKIGYWDNWKEYTVRAGRHSSNMPRMVIQDNFIQFVVEVDSSWYYTVPAERNGISKIVGIGFGDHHKNSARLGFICIENTLWLCGYCYVNGISPQENTDFKKRIMKVTHGLQIQGRIHYNKKTRQYNFFIDDLPVWSCEAGNGRGVKTVLTPYIGGTYTLPHDAKFKIMMVK